MALLAIAATAYESEFQLMCKSPYHWHWWRCWQSAYSYIQVHINQYHTLFVGNVLQAAHASEFHSQIGVPVSAGQSVCCSAYSAPWSDDSCLMQCVALPSVQSSASLITQELERLLSSCLLSYLIRTSCINIAMHNQCQQPASWPLHFIHLEVICQRNACGLCLLQMLLAAMHAAAHVRKF